MYPCVCVCVSVSVCVRVSLSVCDCVRACACVRFNWLHHRLVFSLDFFSFRCLSIYRLVIVCGRCVTFVQFSIYVYIRAFAEPPAWRIYLFVYIAPCSSQRAASLSVSNRFPHLFLWLGERFHFAFTTSSHESAVVSGSGFSRNYTAMAYVRVPRYWSILFRCVDRSYS